MRILEVIICAIISGVMLLRHHRTDDQPAPNVEAPMSREEVDAMLAVAAKAVPDANDYEHSIVDLMKVLHLDSSLGARKELAHELGYRGALSGLAEMNTWLHKAVMEQMAERILMFRRA